MAEKRAKFKGPAQSFRLKKSVQFEGPSWDDSCWCPRASVVFNVLLSARITSAFVSNISDCDEAFNYWEPTHFLMYGSGFQTWEYSPEYAIRSYAYILLHVLPASIVKDFLFANKLTVFYYIRFILGISCAALEAFFYKAIQYQFGNHTARLYFLFTILCTGMYIAASAYLPSSFAMYCCFIAYGGWFYQSYGVAIFGIALGSLVGWPFFALLGVPIAFDLVIRQRKLWTFAQWSFGILMGIMIPVVAIDSHYYGKQVIAPLNIILYNVFGQGGPDLYGVESWTFYFINGFLNFNIVFIMAMVSLPFYVFTRRFVKEYSGYSKIPVWLCLSAIYIWALVFFTRPHKEERFLFPIYPLLLLNAVVTISNFQALYHHWFTSSIKQHYSDSSNWVPGVLLAIFSLVCFSRSSALYVGYHAPLDVYPELQNLVKPYDPDIKPIFKESDEVTVCVGREWYRYPSSFFLPDNWKYGFIKSDFAGQLPQPYQQGKGGTKVIPANMNDMNREEISAYTPIEKCELMIDINLSTNSPHEENYSNKSKVWEVIYTKKFLLASRSSSIFRAFYIPLVSEHYTSYVDYNILKRKRNKQKRWRKTVNV